MANSMLFTKCENWIHGRCAKIKRVTVRLEMCFFCWRCRKTMEGTVDLIEKLCNEVETVNGFYHMEDRLNSSGGCEAAVTKCKNWLGKIQEMLRVIAWK